MTPRPEAAPLVLYVIYGRPSDYPDQFVCRRWDGRTGKPIDEGTPFAIGATLDAVRKQLPAGLFNLGRQAGDDWAIEETWV